MKVTLQSGRELDFSEEELKQLKAILDKQYSNETTVAQKPTEGKWFQVKTSTIDRTLFQKKREDEDQEETRQLILEAFKALKRDVTFKTMMPKYKGILYPREAAHIIEKIPRYIGDGMAFWAEQALEWAQRIANGESWEAVCNNPDTANWYRAVRWKDHTIRLVGGAVRFLYEDSNPLCLNHKYYCIRDNPSSAVSEYGFTYKQIISGAVPLVVAYNKESEE